MPFSFIKTDIPDVVVVEPRILSDARGFFAELYKASDFKKTGIDVSFVQVNQSRSQKNVLRGLHYQLNPRAQAKLVCVLRGEVFDVAVDIRKGSPTFGKWVGEHLSDANKRMLYIPVGFAHGFCVLSAEAELMYYCSGEYAAECDRTIMWNDPVIHVAWPVTEPILSPKDSGGKLLSQADNNFVFNAR